MIDNYVQYHVFEFLSGDVLHAGTLTELGKGLAEVAYTLTTAGPFRIAARLPGSPEARTFHGACLPGPLSLARCTLLEHAAAETAGSTGTVLLQQADR